MQRARIDCGQPLEQSCDAISQIKRLAVEHRQRAPHAAIGGCRSGLDVGGLGVFSDRRCSRLGHLGGQERPKRQQSATGADGRQNAGR